jgi:hypothetical protein
MTQSEMRAVHRLVAADVVEITDDVRLFRVLKIEKASSDQGALQSPSVFDGRPDARHAAAWGA